MSSSAGRRSNRLIAAAKRCPFRNAYFRCISEFMIISENSDGLGYPISQTTRPRRSPEPGMMRPRHGLPRGVFANYQIDLRAYALAADASAIDILEDTAAESAPSAL